jgi:hypothetical protein
MALFALEGSVEIVFDAGSYRSTVVASEPFSDCPEKMSTFPSLVSTVVGYQRASDISGPGLQLDVLGS